MNWRTETMSKGKSKGKSKAKRCPNCGKFMRAVTGLRRVRNRSAGRSFKERVMYYHQCSCCGRVA